MAETLTIRTAASTEVIKIAVQGPQGPAGAPGTGLETLTTQGDTLYRGASTGERLPIGTAGQVLKVVNGLPAWANESGAVSSVAGRTGAVTLVSADISSEQVLEISEAGDANCNGVFVYGGDLNGRPTYYKDKDTFVYWDNVWNISNNDDDKYVGTNTSRPWQAVWSLGSATGNLPVVTQLNGQEYEKAVGQRTNPTSLGTASAKNVGTGANDVAAGNDARFSDARQPLSHSSTHHTGGTDALAAHQINGQTIFGTGTSTYSSDQTLGAARALQLTVSNTNASGINLTLPVQSDGTLNGDTYVIVGGSTVSGPITIRRINVLSPLIYETLATITATGQQYRFRATGATTGGWTLVPVDTHTHPSTQITGLGTAATQDSTAFAPATGIDPTAITGTAVVDSDARLSDSRTPSSHASSHASAGSDPLFDQDLNTTAAAQFESVTVTDLFTQGFEATGTGGNLLRVLGDGLEFVGTSAATTRTNLGLGTAAVADIGNGAGDVAEGDHGHGNINSSGQVGTTANLPLKTGTGGIVEAGVFGTGAGEFAEGNHTHADLHTRSHAITSTSDHTAGNHKVFYSNGSGDIVELALGNSGEVLTSNGATSAPSFAAASGGVTTGSVDNAILRADGTGGSTSQSSDLVIDDATTSTQNNVAITNQHSGQTDSALVLTPKGAGAFIVGPKPDGTSTGGNARGARSIDIQTARMNAADVASGTESVAIGYRCRATSSGGVAIGNNASAVNGVAIGTGGVSQSADESVSIGRSAGSSASGAAAFGRFASASGVDSVAIGASAGASLRGSFGARSFSAVYWGGQTTNDTPLILNLDATATNRFTIAANTALAVDILLVARRSDTADKWLVARRFLGIRRDGSNNTSLIGSVQTLGTDQSDGSPTWSFALTADDTNEALQLEVTGAASETVQWRATAFYRVV